MRIMMYAVAGTIACAVIGPAHAQDIPGTSPMDHAAMSMAHTSGTIDSLSTKEVARRQNARTTRRTATRAAPPRRTAQTAEACRQSTPILRNMGLQPHPDCR